MPKTRDKLLDKTGGARPYIERAFTDEDLRDNVRNAFESAREVYNELLGGRGAIPVATRVATDKDIQERLKEAIDGTRRAQHAAARDGDRARDPLQPGVGRPDAQMALRHALRVERRVHVPGWG